MVEKITPSTKPISSIPESESSRGDVIATMLKHKKKKGKSDPRDEVPNVYIPVVLSPPQDKPIALRLGQRAVPQGAGQPAAAGDALHNPETILPPLVTQRNAVLARYADKSRRAAAMAHVAALGAVEKPEAAPRGLHAAHPSPVPTPERRKNPIPADVSGSAVHAASFASPARVRTEQENAAPATAGAGPSLHTASGVMPSPDKASGQPSRAPHAFAAQQERQNRAHQVTTDDSQTLRLTYSFQRWSGEHGVNVALRRQGAREGNVTLVPSDARAAEALQRHLDAWPTRSPDILYPDRDEREHKGRQPQDEHDEEQQ